MLTEDIKYCSPSLTDPVSQLCTASQFEEPAYSYWCEQIKEKPRTHRKQWEFCYIAQALAKAGMLVPGRRGVGFGVGVEPLVSLFAARGVEILATDLELLSAVENGWADTNQHAIDKSILNQRNICDSERFNRYVSHRYVDMNDIPSDLGEFDFCWSACALEHLGSIEKAMTFVKNSIQFLRPGGIAVHTSEINCSSDDDTLDYESTVLIRRRDYRQLRYDVVQMGYGMEVNFHSGDSELDKHIDLPPYGDHNHLKLQLSGWVTGSFGIIVKK